MTVTSPAFLLRSLRRSSCRSQVGIQGTERSGLGRTMTTIQVNPALSTAVEVGVQRGSGICSSHSGSSWQSRGLPTTMLAET